MSVWQLLTWEVIPLKPQSRRKYKMAKRGKKYQEAAKACRSFKSLLDVTEAIELAKKTSYC